MKKFLLATSALILIAAAQPAYAADQSALPHLPSKTAIVPPAAIYNWNGCYIGAHGGGGAVSDTFVAGGGLNSENFLHGGSGFAGGQLGCNVQNGVMVLGGDGFSPIIQGHDATPSPNFLTRTIPANTLVSGQEYFIFASFQAVIDLKLLPALPGT